MWNGWETLPEHERSPSYFPTIQCVHWWLVWKTFNGWVFGCKKYMLISWINNGNYRILKEPRTVTDIFWIAFMFNGGKSPASIFRPIHIQICTGHSNRINHELYSEPSFPESKLYLLLCNLRSIPLSSITLTLNPNFRIRTDNECN